MVYCQLTAKIRIIYFTGKMNRKVISVILIPVFVAVYKCINKLIFNVQTNYSKTVSEERVLSSNPRHHITSQNAS